MALRNDSADAYFLSCANIHTIDVIGELERDLGKPVVTSNQASAGSLRAAGIRDGRLRPRRASPPRRARPTCRRGVTER